MSWKKRTGNIGRVAVGNPVLANQKTDEDKDGVTLEAGWSVVVDSMTFKLTKD